MSDMLKPIAYLLEESKGGKTSILYGKMFMTQQTAIVAAARLTNRWRRVRAIPVISGEQASIVRANLRKALGFVMTAEHDEGCELDPEFGEQNLRANIDNEVEDALADGGDERDVKFRDWPGDATCTCGLWQEQQEFRDLVMGKGGN